MDRHEYETKDLALATYLQLTVPGGSVREFEWDESSCTFVHMRSDELLAAVEDYECGKGLVEPRTFVIESSKIKRMMFRHQPSKVQT